MCARQMLFAGDKNYIMYLRQKVLNTGNLVTRKMLEGLEKQALGWASSGLQDYKGIQPNNCCLLTSGTHSLAMIQRFRDHLQNRGLQSKHNYNSQQQNEGLRTQPILPNQLTYKDDL